MVESKVDHIIKNTEWEFFEKAPNCPLWFVWDTLKMYVTRLSQHFRVPHFACFYFYQHGDLIMYYRKGDFALAGNTLLKKDKEQPGLIDGIFVELKKQAESLERSIEEIRTTPYNSQDNQALKDLFERARTQHEDLWFYGQSLNWLEQGHSLIGDRLRQLLREAHVAQEALEEVFVVMTTPSTYSELQREEQALLKMVELGIDDKGLNQHWQKYSWLGYNWGGPGYELSYFKERAALLQQDSLRHIHQKSEDQYAQEVEAKRQACINKYHFSQEIVTLAKVAENIIVTKNLRIDTQWKFYSTADEILRQIATQNRVAFETCQFLVPQDIEKALMGEPVDFTLAAERRKNVAFLSLDGKLYEYYGQEATDLLQFLKRSTEKHQSEKITQLSGACGSPGFARGRVRVVNVPEEIEKMTLGDVLVSHTTNPTLVPAMKLAAAIVTDIGGMTSHAAIVARELKKPCVIGTKIATQVLKDGDLVEVDADNGVVRIIEKAILNLE